MRNYLVAPRAGAWIETYMIRLGIEKNKVAPRAGAWIETLSCGKNLKPDSVAPRAGAWIETLQNRFPTQHLCRAPRGRVD